MAPLDDTPREALSATVLEGGGGAFDDADLQDPPRTTSQDPARRNQRDPLVGQWLTPRSRFVRAALWNVDPEDRKENGPVMTGSGEIIIDGRTVTVPISAFRHVGKESEQQYLGLVIGGEHDHRYRGALFRGDGYYSGSVQLLPLDGTLKYSPEEWDAADRLRVTGRPEQGQTKPRIALNIFPETASFSDFPI